jgi:diguanylate cyclase (GGDEF)-like protein
MIAQVVHDPQQATTALRSFQADLLLLDMHMPGCTGLELAAVIRQQPAYVGLPIVFLSGETDPLHQSTARDLGGDDYLVKPIRPEALVHAVTTRAHRARAMRAMMMRDSLTGLFNHSATTDLLELEIERARRNNTPLSVVMIDIDHFKTVNDNYGHSAGDAVLRDLARLLQQRLRRSDVIGRYGGEEFLLILPNTPGLAAAQLIDAIRISFSALRHSSADGDVHVTFSAGIAQLPPHEDTPIQLVQSADKALYRAKRAGRNQVRRA